MSVYLSVCLSVCLCVSLSLSVNLSLCLSVYLPVSIYLSVSLLVSLCICMYLTSRIIGTTYIRGKLLGNATACSEVQHLFLNSLPTLQINVTICLYVKIE